ncbi:hypothetical protein DSI03_14835, partial [Enterococcus faecalis]|nr:hypothetical protein [Enterococcus faecalis]
NTFSFNQKYKTMYFRQSLNGYLFKQDFLARCTYLAMIATGNFFLFLTEKKPLMVYLIYPKNA